MSQYLLWDIDEADLYYTFTKDQIESVDMIEMINLNIRGATSEYTLPTDVSAGKILTICNRDFGYNEEGIYFGVKLILAPEGQDKANYYFFFKDQTVSFYFNGDRWFLKEPWPLPLSDPNFIEEQTIEEGYLNLRDYRDSQKGVLFTNLNLGSFKPSSLEGRFFRDGEFGLTQEDLFQAHTHNGDFFHNHIIQGNPLLPLDIFLSSKKLKKYWKQQFKVNLKVQTFLEIIKPIINILEQEDSKSYHKILKILQEFFYGILYRSSDEIIHSGSRIKKLKVKKILPEVDISKIITDAIKDGINSSFSILIPQLQSIFKNIFPIWDIIIAKIVLDIKNKYQRLAKWLEDNKDTLKDFIQKNIIDDPNSFKNTLISFLTDKYPTIIENFLREHILLVDIPEKVIPGDRAVFKLIDNWLIPKNKHPKTYCSKPDGSPTNPDGKNDNERHQCPSLVESIINSFDLRQTEINHNETYTPKEGETRPKNIQGHYIVKCW